MTTVELPPRATLPRERTWDLESIFPNDEAWKSALKDLSENGIPKLAAFQGTLAAGAAHLADWFEQSEAVFTDLIKVYLYAALMQSQDTNDQRSQAMLGQAGAVYGRLLATTAFSEPEILAVGESAVNGWVESEPRLAIYKHYSHDLFRKQQHVRSAEVEETLGILSDTFRGIQNTADMLTNADLTFPPALTSGGEALPLGQGTADTLKHHPDREARRTGWQNYCDAYLTLKNTLASNLIANVKREVGVSRVRRFKTALEGSLFQTNIPSEVFHNLIATFQKHLPLWHRYWGIKRRVLGVEQMHHWDIWAPLTPNKPHIPYEQAVQWIADGMSPLGGDYVEVLQAGCLADRWVDVLPNKGKAQGAFSSGAKGTKPFILVSYDNSIGALSTLAHELGHSMHSYLTWQHQPFVYTDYSLFVAEVASNFNQALVRAHLFEANSDKDFQLAVIDEAMENFHRYFFIMPTLARFELEMHTRVEGGDSPTADDMIDLMADLFTEGYGGEVAVDRLREGITWAQFGHLYQNFYVYAYATGISAANALAARVRGGQADAAKNYLKFLSAGSSVYPLEALKIAGVDMTTPKPIEEAFAVLGGIVERLDRLTQ
ncbi:MAG TPA: oligoendopeptidase F [Aggregatilineales bacterium]|nr:oligoendopeptidase F [Anaerolineales bacterium]HRE49728.1 oligoendopeptidase F [Aggregatilineales bacterium]